MSEGLRSLRLPPVPPPPAPCKCFQNSPGLSGVRRLAGPPRASECEQEPLTHPPWEFRERAPLPRRPARPRQLRLPLGRRRKGPPGITGWGPHLSLQLGLMGCLSPCASPDPVFAVACGRPWGPSLQSVLTQAHADQIVEETFILGRRRERVGL